MNTLGYSLEVPQRGNSNENPNICGRGEVKKDINTFWLQKAPYLGPVVQSVASLTSLLVVKILTVLLSIISNSQVFLLKKCK